MELPDTFPTDIDYDWYLKECNEMLTGIGMRGPNGQMSLLLL
jgi:hypothetical protein